MAMLANAVPMLLRIVEVAQSYRDYALEIGLAEPALQSGKTPFSPSPEARYLPPASWSLPSGPSGSSGPQCLVATMAQTV